MPRSRISISVDTDLLVRARLARVGASDSALIQEALKVLLALERAAELDALYAAYDGQPLDEPDEWGNLSAFRSAAGAS